MVNYLRLRYQAAENKINPAQASENKQIFKDKIYRDLHIFSKY